jgi:hypothetical protein
MFTDVLIHAWDVAKATGQDIMLPRQGQTPEVVFGTDQGVADSADLQTRLLGMLGRSLDWKP